MEHLQQLLDTQHNPHQKRLLLLIAEIVINSDWYRLQGKLINHCYNNGYSRTEAFNALGLLERHGFLAIGNSSGCIFVHPTEKLKGSFTNEQQ